MTYKNRKRRTARVVDDRTMNALKRTNKLSGYEIARRAKPKIKPVAAKSESKTRAL